MEAEKLIAMHPSESTAADAKDSKRQGGGWKETDFGDGTQTMKLTDDDEVAPSSSGGRSYGPDGGEDLFEMALNKHTSRMVSSGHRSNGPTYRVLQVDDRVLAGLKPTEVFVLKYPTQGVRNKYYKNMIPDIKIHFSPHCRRFFHEEDFELEYIKEGYCPCCRISELEENN